MHFSVIYLVLINVAAFLLYGFDKYKSKRNQRRISEFSLLLIAALGGSIGALLGMDLFRHKTQHKKFRIGLPVIVLLQLALMYFIMTRFV